LPGYEALPVGVERPAPLPRCVRAAGTGHRAEVVEALQFHGGQVGQRAQDEAGVDRAGRHQPGTVDDGHVAARRGTADGVPLAGARPATGTARRRNGSDRPLRAATAVRKSNPDRSAARRGDRPSTPDPGRTPMPERPARNASANASVSAAVAHSTPVPVTTTSWPPVIARVCAAAGRAYRCRAPRGTPPPARRPAGRPLSRRPSVRGRGCARA